MKKEKNKVLKKEKRLIDKILTCKFTYRIL